MRSIPVLISAASLAAIVVSAGCGTSANERPTNASAASAASASASPDGLTPFQVEHGIGPVTEPVVLKDVDRAMAQAGHELFEHKCAACHKMADRYVGPALGDVTKRRSPAFVMNMVLNPQVMTTKHPVSRKLLGEFYTQMPNLNLSPTEARQLLEYLRTQAH
jgi:cytochrome c551/c552